MVLQAFINFNGNCREAVEFYAKTFGVEKQQMMTFGDMPNPDFPMDDDVKKRIVYTFLNIDGHNLMFSDTMPGMPFVAGNNISLTYGSTDKKRIEKLFNDLKAGGKVEMELQKTFWSESYGMVTDKFGIQWQLSLDDGKMQ
ncbi:hypothetical protein MsAg5_05800 [Methanosarcinaceae archaeon Ag5]|uniref:PhnB-like domain-containing protein n=2 Tax=Methanolapillus africanus TaxID=3028297 RepID=A0AAE4MJE5_9EURY|nr:hypothetical protein [Methanosarcinaceae archaeon Ag5]